MNTLATTKQVRKVMRGFGCISIWTNCYDAHSDTRHVKCYAPFRQPLGLMKELAELSGDENVWMTSGEQSYYGIEAIIVRCRLEK